MTYSSLLSCLIKSTRILLVEKSLEIRFVLIQNSMCICKVLITENSILILKGGP